MFLVRYDSSGDTLWTRSFQNEFGFDEIGYSAIYDEDSFLIVGVGGAENGYARGVVAKTDLEGNTLWKKYYAGYTGPTSSTIFSSIDNAFEGGYVVGSGTRSCSTCPFQHHLVRLDEDGNVLWSDIVTNTADDGEIQPLHYGDGTYFGFGERCLDEDAYYECKPYLLKYDESGDTLWTKVYGDQWGVRSYFTVGKKLSDGHLFTGGQIENDNYQKGFIMKLDTSGQEIWKRIYVNIEGNECRFNDFTELTTGELVAVGVAWPQVGPPLVGQDTWIVKTDSYGCLIPGCHVSVEELEEERRSFLAGPNPVSTVLNLYLPGEVEHRGQTRFRITDSSGHLIREFSADTGSTTYMLDVSQYTAGIYLVTLLVDQQVIGTERIVVE
ncbi:MAG: T9SS type A sorting domain-containing protein [Flavobacteriales bacterium]